MRCPLCGKVTKTGRGLAKHLTGGIRYGGHEVSQVEAVEIVATQADVPVQAVLPAAPEPNAVERQALPPDVQAGFLYGALARVVDNKDLPKYQFERVIDAFLGSFMPGIMQWAFGGSVSLVAQELPIKKISNNQSTNMDYVLCRHDSTDRPGVWIFVELKTDPLSVETSQALIYAERVVGRTMAELLDDVRTIRDSSSRRTKYNELLGRFEGYPLDRGIEVAYLSPLRHTASDLLPIATAPETVAAFEHVLRSITFEDLEQVELADHAGEWDLFQELVLPKLRA